MILQIPVDPQVRKKAEREAENLGFSSLQDAVRLYLKKLADKRIRVELEERKPVVQLSPKAIKRYNKILDDIEKGKNLYHAKDIDDLMRQLNES